MAEGNVSWQKIFCCSLLGVLLLSGVNLDIPCLERYLCLGEEGSAQGNDYKLQALNTTTFRFKQSQFTPGFLGGKVLLK